MHQELGDDQGAVARGKRHHQGGFSLVECVLAIVIVGGALVVGIELLGAHASAVAKQGEALLAELCLTNDVELVRCTDYESLVSRSFAADADYPKVEVSREVNPSSAKCLSVRVVVRWRDGSGAYVNRSLTTFRCAEVKP